MGLVLTEEQNLLKESARDYLKENASIALLRQLRDDNDENRFSSSVWKSMTEMGWSGLIIPEEFGGMGFEYVGMGQVLEETGRSLTASPLLSTALTTATLINLAGNQDQKEKYLTAIAEGTIVSLASEDSSHHDPSKVKLSATSKGEGYILSGKKNYVLDGQVADHYIVSARTSEEEKSEKGISLFIIPASAAGITKTNATLMDSRVYAHISFDNVEVSAEHLLGELDKGYKPLQKTLDIATIGLSAELLGIIQESFERTISYLKERRQFDRIIGSFQALQHRAAHMYCEIEICKSLVIKALQGIDEDSFMLPALASMAKAKCSKVAQLVTNEGVQMFGGIGMTDDEDIGLYLKRSRVAMELYGNYNYHLDRFAKLNAY